MINPKDTVFSPEAGILGHIASFLDPYSSRAAACVSQDFFQEFSSVQTVEDELGELTQSEREENQKSVVDFVRAELVRHQLLGEIHRKINDASLILIENGMFVIKNKMEYLNEGGLIARCIKKFKFYSGKYQSDLALHCLNVKQQISVKVDQLRNQQLPVSLQQMRDRITRVLHFGKEINALYSIVCRQLFMRQNALSDLCKIVNLIYRFINLFRFDCNHLEQNLFNYGNEVIGKRGRYSTDYDYNHSLIEKMRLGQSIATPNSQRGIIVGKVNIRNVEYQVRAQFSHFRSILGYPELSDESSFSISLNDNLLGSINVHRQWRHALRPEICDGESSYSDIGMSQLKNRFLEVEKIKVYELESEDGDRPVARALAQLAVEILIRENEANLSVNCEEDQFYVYVASSFVCRSDPWGSWGKNIMKNMSAAREAGLKFPRYRKEGAFEVTLSNRDQKGKKGLALAAEVDFGDGETTTWGRIIQDSPILTTTGKVLPRYSNVNLRMAEIQ